MFKRIHNTLASTLAQLRSNKHVKRHIGTSITVGAIAYVIYKEYKDEKIFEGLSPNMKPLYQYEAMQNFYNFPGTVAIIGSNICVHVLGLWFPEFAERHLTLSLANIRARRWHTLLTYFLFHRDFAHLYWLTYVHYSLKVVEIELGNWFVPFYVASGIGAGLASIVAKRLINNAIGTIGASACVLGIVGAFTCMHPNSHFQCIHSCFITHPNLGTNCFPSPPMVFPIDATTSVTLLLALQIVGLTYYKPLANFGSVVDFVAHMGGLIIGYAIVKKMQDKFTILEPLIYRNEKNEVVFNGYVNQKTGKKVVGLQLLNLTNKGAYIGRFDEHEEYHGYGTMAWNNNIIIGLFEHGHFKHGTKLYLDETVKIVGTFQKPGTFQGTTVVKTKEHVKKYQGTFENWLLHGENCSLTVKFKESGNVYVYRGTFEESELVDGVVEKNGKLVYYEKHQAK